MVFQTMETARAVRYIEETYGAAPEFLWARTPSNAVFRHQHNGKWFAALLLDTPQKRLGLPGPDTVDILDLKCTPLMIGSLIDGRGILPGYHMNKEHWITVLLNGLVPWGQVQGLIDLSYDITR